MKDRNGNAVTVTVDSAGKPTKVTDQANRTYTIAYASNRISKITENATGRAVTYTYDTSGKLSSVTDSNGVKIYYTYNTSGYLTNVKDNTNSKVIEKIDYYPLNSGESLPTVKQITNKNGNYDSYIYNKSEEYTEEICEIYGKNK
jgi:YD repeat-containing protein